MDFESKIEISKELKEDKYGRGLINVGEAKRLFNLLLEKINKVEVLSPISYNTNIGEIMVDDRLNETTVYLNGEMIFKLDYNYLMMDKYRHRKVRALSEFENKLLNISKTNNKKKFI